MLVKIISGGRTGACQAAWRAARSHGVSTGGWMPAGFLNEDGPHPEFAEEFAASSLSDDDERTREAANVRDSDATLWFGETTTSDAQRTVRACQELGKPCLPISPDASFLPSHVVNWIRENQIRSLNVAGNEECEEPGIGERVEGFLGAVLEQLGHARA